MLSNTYFSLLIFLLSIQSIVTLRCYECKNCTNSSCECSTIYETNLTDSFCLLGRENLYPGEKFEIGHAPQNERPFPISDSSFISVQEIIVYNETIQKWLSQSKEIIYGCPTDLCNQDNLLKELPSVGLSLMLPSEWLNTKLLRKNPGDSILCRGCDGQIIRADSIEKINQTLCPRADCSGTCFVEIEVNRTGTTEFSYTSVCPSETSNNPDRQLSSVTIEAVYYINTDVFQIYDMQIVCNGEYCTTLDLFTDIPEKLQKDLRNIRPFLPNHVQSIYSTSIVFLIMLLFIQISIS